MALKREGCVRPHGVFGGARLGWAGQTDLGADREATHCQGAGWGSKDWDVGGAARALEGTWGLPTREVGAPGGADSAAGMAHVRKWCSCSGRGRGSARSLKGGGHWRISAKVGCQRGLRNGGRTSTQSCRVGRGRGCRGARAEAEGAGGVRGRHARARAGERPGLGHVPLLSLSTDSWAGAEGGSSSGSSGRRRPSLRGASVAEAGGHETWSTSGCRLNIFLLLNVPFFFSSTQYKLLPKDEV